MELYEYRDEIKLLLSGDTLNLEISDSTIDSLINSAFRELQRYIDNTQLITIPYKQCIDMTQYKVNSVVRIYRTTNSEQLTSVSYSDPTQLSMIQFLNSNLNNYQDYFYNYSSYNTLLQTRNVLSTDLSFMYDKSTNKLYINTSIGTPSDITIEYIPIYTDVSQITSSYWSNMLLRLSLALTKTTLGRIRSRFTQSNALWQQDGDTILNEGTQELNQIRDELVKNTQLVYPID